MYFYSFNIKNYLLFLIKQERLGLGVRERNHWTFSRDESHRGQDSTAKQWGKHKNIFDCCCDFFNDFYFEVRRKLSVIRCYTWFFSLVEKKVLIQRIVIGFEAILEKKRILPHTMLSLEYQLWTHLLNDIK